MHRYLATHNLAEQVGDGTAHADQQQDRRCRQEALGEFAQQVAIGDAQHRKGSPLSCVASATIRRDQVGADKNWNRGGSEADRLRGSPNALSVARKCAIVAAALADDPYVFWNLT